MRIRGIRNIEAARSAATVLLLGVGACSFAPDPEPLTPVETLPEAYAEATIQGEYTPRIAKFFHGNLRTRRLIIEEGATFNGECAMRTPAQRAEK